MRATPKTVFTTSGWGEGAMDDQTQCTPCMQVRQFIIWTGLTLAAITGYHRYQRRESAKDAPLGGHEGRDRAPTASRLGDAYVSRSETVIAAAGVASLMAFSALGTCIACRFAGYGCKYKCTEIGPFRLFCHWTCVDADPYGPNPGVFHQ